MGVERHTRKMTALMPQRKNKVPTSSLPFFLSFFLSKGSPSCNLTCFPAAVSQPLRRVRRQLVESGHKDEANFVLTHEVKATGADIHMGTGTYSFRQGLRVTSCILLN